MNLTKALPIAEDPAKCHHTASDEIDENNLVHSFKAVSAPDADSDHSDLVARRMGFMPLPLGVVTFRILSQSLPLHNFTSYALLGLALASIITFRVLNGIIMLGKACDIIEEAERRKAQADASFDTSATASKPSLSADETAIKGSLSSSINESNLNGDLKISDDPAVLSSSNACCSSSKLVCCCCCHQRSRQLSTSAPVRTTDEEDGLEYLTPLRNSTC
ncbi:Tapt1 family, partial [Trinorchestia longiramus]